jgi:hypothetical protein
MARAADIAKNDKMITALFRFILPFMAGSHCIENMHRQISPSTIENHGFRTTSVRVGSTPPKSMNILLNIRAILGNTNRPNMLPTT